MHKITNFFVTGCRKSQNRRKYMETPKKMPVFSLVFAPGFPAKGQQKEWGKSRTFSPDFLPKSAFLSGEKQILLFRGVFLYIIPFRGTFRGVKLFKLRIDFPNFIV